MHALVYGPFYYFLPEVRVYVMLYGSQILREYLSYSAFAEMNSRKMVC